MSPHWPLVGLRLRAQELDLRPVTEADLPALAALLPDDVELDPSLPLQDRTLALHQGYWRALGSWRPEAWRLGFAVRLRDELVGFQELEGNDFPVLRTVDTSSWLSASARGLGVGKAMRRVVLALAFGPMEAQAAITSAWEDNVASLGVSRAVGYVDNGVSVEKRGEGAGVMVHLRLPRSQWQGPDVEISGFEECRELFGL